MNQLCKDLEICLKALFARLLSQAEQKCVTISDTRVLDNLTQRYVTGLYDDNFTLYSHTCTSPSCGDIMRSISKLLFRLLFSFFMSFIIINSNN